MPDTLRIPARHHGAFAEGFACGIKRAVAWLHDRAIAMADPNACAVLHGAATSLGRHRKAIADDIRIARTVAADLRRKWEWTRDETCRDAARLIEAAYLGESDRG